METRLLGLDVGDKRVGVAVTEWGEIVLPLVTLPRDRDTIRAIARLVEERDIERVVAGLPLSLDDSLGPQALKVQTFLRRLRASLPIPVDTVDERFTSVDAEARLLEVDASRARRRATLDQYAAVEILRSYLNGRG
ncbi:MAG TPA: Holliday junction resolvase RuvX [Armatimonadota bacterium]